MFNHIKSKIPGRLKLFIRNIYKWLLRQLWFLKYSGNNFVCNFCNANLKNFDGQRCPHCDSMMRHRVIWDYLKNNLHLFSPKMKVLHFAPERCFKKVFRKMNVQYYDADFNADRARYHVDIRKIPFDDQYFDAILCVHVLEHIDEDVTAMRELFRVLKPGGWSILQSPLDINRQDTLEDASVKTSEDRLKVYGDFDHRRIYGKDYLQRIERVGFKVSLKDDVSKKSAHEIERYGLRREDIYFCTKDKN